MDFNTTFDGRKCDHTTRIPLCCKTPLERTLGELPCLCSAQNPNMLVNLSVSRAVQAICAERSTSTNNNATEAVERRLEQLMGALLRDYASEEGERSAEHNLKISQTFKDEATQCFRFAPCTPHACTRTRLQHPRSLRATLLCSMCKYAERCGDRGPVTIPGHGPAS